MMNRPQIQSFEEFWPFYVREHRLRSTRVFHFVGTTLAMAAVIFAVATQMWWALILAPILGYGLAWISHFGIEKNKPASFYYPLWSFMGDLKLWGLMVAGRMEAEAQRILAMPAK